MDYSKLSARKVIAAIRERKLTVSEYVEILHQRCKRYQHLNSFIFQDWQRIKEAAEQADNEIRSGKTMGLLHGVPVVLKDNIDMAGIPTTAGTPALKNHIPRRNAPIVQSLTNAGAIIFGKANMHELAQGITNNNFHFGPARNPYDQRLIPGGSSGGCAVAISAFLTPLAVGTDTGGSVRIPAALCGILGFRPSLNRYSNEGIFPISHTRDTAGPMGRSVQDLILLDRVISGNTVNIAPAELNRLRFGIPKASSFETVQKEVTAEIYRAFKRLNTYGVELVEIDLTEIRKLDTEAGFPIAQYETIEDINNYLASHNANLDFSAIVSEISSPDVKSILENAINDREALKEKYDEAMAKHRPDLQSAYKELFEKKRLAAIVQPTTPFTARPIADSALVDINGKKVPLFAVMIGNTSPSSLAGNPCLSLPIGFSPDGLPVGLHIETDIGSDNRLLSIALAIEEKESIFPRPKLNSQVIF